MNTTTTIKIFEWLTKPRMYWTFIDECNCVIQSLLLIYLLCLLYSIIVQLTKRR